MPSVAFQFTINDPSGYFAPYPLLTYDLQAAGELVGASVNGLGTISVIVTPDPSIATAAASPAGYTPIGQDTQGNEVERPWALTEALTGVDPNGTGPEINMFINSTTYLQSMFFDPSGAARVGAVPTDKTDFISVMTHELMHGMGFIGFRQFTPGAGFNTFNPANERTMFDEYSQYNVGGTNGIMYFTGPQAEAAYGGLPVPLTSIAENQPGSGEDFYHVGNPSGSPGDQLVMDDMNGVAFYPGRRYDVSALDVAILRDTGWTVNQAPEYRADDISVGADGNTRLIWDTEDGRGAYFDLNGSLQLVASAGYGTYPGWTMIASSAGADGLTRVLWQSDSGGAALWLLNNNGAVQANVVSGPFAGWSPVGLAADRDPQDDYTHLMWASNSGQLEIWTLNAQLNVVAYSPVYGGTPGWTPAEIAAGNDGLVRVLWNSTAGGGALWLLSATGQFMNAQSYGPFAGWTATAIAVDAGSNTRILWVSSGGAGVIWSVDARFDTPTSTQVFGPYAGFEASALATAPDGTLRLLWTGFYGAAYIWDMRSDGEFLGWQAYGPVY